ncbi:MAG: hypothetical protein V1689_13890, partial [Pseudomonadota bacterium]
LSQENKVAGEEKALYTSRRSWRSLWQQHRIYADRIELSSCIGTKTIPVADIVDIEVRPPLVIGDLFRGKGFAYCWALKLDLADLCRHVALLRTSGIMKRLRFSPDDAATFVEVCRSVMKEKTR